MIRRTFHRYSRGIPAVFSRLLQVHKDTWKKFMGKQQSLGQIGRNGWVRPELATGYHIWLSTPQNQRDVALVVLLWNAI